MREKAGTLYHYLRLPNLAKRECIRDWLHILGDDPGAQIAIREGIGWLCRAQDCSTSKDGGVARHFSLIDGWSASYPETTGYIIPTMIEYGKIKNDHSVMERAKRMLDWLLRIQLPNGGFQGGLIDSEPVVPVTFNTGQILIGLAAGVREFGEEYMEAMARAADWLVETQDPDGAWRRHATPFASPGEKTYETHVAWGLFEAARIETKSRYADAAIANVRWGLGNQRENGWFAKCCLTDPSQPLTHTIGYALRGLIEAYDYSKDPSLLEASCKTADALLGEVKRDGFIPGRLNESWKGKVKWSCLTGSAQIAFCWLKLYQFMGKKEYRHAALVANRYVRRTIYCGGIGGRRGGIKGSFPVYGGYGAYQYLNWAVKFFVDANLLELSIIKAEKETLQDFNMSKR